VEMHPIILETGRIVEFNKLEKRVIRVLLEDPRMSLSEIAKKTGLTAEFVEFMGI
jgi:DNA-binding Lrp family transcriptional regulator